ncbi:alpha/beta fold hydrolase [Capilliphycus salinus ALCB114379]|uniref:alpha/beta fold hydrolase n=1 Tax=Capilliphycus salinus TaxID=2768948 RepID=UPI0039A6A240
MSEQFGFNLIRLAFLSLTTSYHLGKTWLENQQAPPGQLIDIDGYKIHLYTQGTGSPTVILDHSLGGLDGYFLIDKIAKITRVCIYDRPGYGWSEPSSKPRCTESIVRELNELLERAEIEPPYILVGNSFGSYNVRLYAHYYPEKVIGMILTDGLSETFMLKLPMALKAIKLFFLSGFLMSILGSILGLVRLLGHLKVFEFIKPDLRQFSPEVLERVKKSFYRPKHWLTMARELWNLEKSASQVKVANSFREIPLISIKAKTFFKRSPWNFYLPLNQVEEFREKMHTDLLRLSEDVSQLPASGSSHFVWIDEPQVILAAIEQLISNLSKQQSDKIRQKE